MKPFKASRFTSLCGESSFANVWYVELTSLWLLKDGLDGCLLIARVLVVNDLINLWSDTTYCIYPVLLIDSSAPCCTRQLAIGKQEKN